jgi:hypothetical protein
MSLQVSQAWKAKMTPEGTLCLQKYFGEYYCVLSIRVLNPCYFYKVPESFQDVVDLFHQCNWN